MQRISVSGRSRPIFVVVCLLSSVGCAKGEEIPASKAESVAEEPMAVPEPAHPVTATASAPDDILGLTAEDADAVTAPLVVAQNDPTPPEAPPEAPKAPEAEENRALVEQRAQQVIQIDAETVDLKHLVRLHRLERLDRYAAKRKWTPGLKPPDLTPQEKVWWKEWEQAQRVPPAAAPPPPPPPPPASVPAP